MDLSGFNGSTVPPASSPEAVPAGWYNVCIVNSEERPVKDKPHNKLLYLEMQILDGQFQGQKIFDRLNLYNDNPTTQEIAWRQLSAYYAALGIVQVPSSQHMHNLPFAVRVSRDKTDKYDTNDVKDRQRFGHTGNATTAASSAPSFAPPPPPPQAGYAPPPPPQQPAPPQAGYAPPPPNGAAPPWAANGAPAPQAPPQYAPPPQQAAPPPPPQYAPQAPAPQYAPQAQAPAPSAPPPQYAPPPAGAPANGAPQPPWATA